jgi:hypothetical protein
LLDQLPHLEIDEGYHLAALLSLRLPDRRVRDQKEQPIDSYRIAQHQRRIASPEDSIAF